MPSDKPTYEQFRAEWLADIADANLSPLDKGRRFASKLVTQWLDVTSDDDDFVVCDGSGDGGIDIAYLKRADTDVGVRDDGSVEGDTWYLVQSKYGTAFAGADTILTEGNKVINTLQGRNHNLSADSQQLLEKLNLFRQQASEADRIALVFATTDPISEQDRPALERVKVIGREEGIRNFDVEEVSLPIIWEALTDVEMTRLAVPVKGQFVEQYSGLLVGTVSLTDLFEFLKSYKAKTGNLDQLYEKNVRKFLGSRRKINKGIANTLNETPEKFGLYNNGITIVVSGYSNLSAGTVNMYDPYVVNGCQTTRTIWEVLDSKFNAGGTGQDAAAEAWKQQVDRGGVVAKIVRSDEAEITNITRFTNSQNSVRDQDFIALQSSFQNWAAAMTDEYRIFLEIQRGGIESRKSWEKQHPETQTYADYVNAFDLIKVYGAGWMARPGVAFGKNAPFLPGGSVYDRIISRQDGESVFGVRDLYAAYKIKGAADQIGFGRSSPIQTRKQSRFLFYHIVMRMLSNVILLTPQFRNPPVSENVLTDAVLLLADPKSAEAFSTLCNAAVQLLDQYLALDGDNSVSKEATLRETHGGDLNGFLKAENLGSDQHSPLLVQSLAIQNAAFNMSGGRERVAEALLAG